MKKDVLQLFKSTISSNLLINFYLLFNSFLKNDISSGQKESHANMPSLPVLVKLVLIPIWSFFLVLIFWFIDVLDWMLWNALSVEVSKLYKFSGELTKQVHGNSKNDDFLPRTSWYIIPSSSISNKILETLTINFASKCIEKTIYLLWGNSLLLKYYKIYYF